MKFILTGTGMRMTPGSEHSSGGATREIGAFSQKYILALPSLPQNNVTFVEISQKFDNCGIKMVDFCTLQIQIQELIISILDVYSKTLHVALDEHELDYDFCLHCRKSVS